MNKLISRWDGMTEEEKNAWITTEVMGLEYIPQQAGLIYSPAYYLDRKTGEKYFSFSPMNDISAAWEVVEKMRRPFSRRKAFADAMYELTNPSPEDMIVSPLEVIWNMNPMNICKAAYLAIMSVK